MQRSKSIFLWLFLAGVMAGAQSTVALGQQTPAPQTQTPPTEAPQPQVRSLPEQAPIQNPAAQTAAAKIRSRKVQRIAALIQDTYSHKFEMYGGGGYLRFRAGDSLQKVTEAAWNVGITEYVRPRLGVTLDARGYYGTAYTYNNVFQIFKPSISQYVFMAGPQYRVTRGPRFATSVRVLAGVDHGNFDTGLGGFHSRDVGLYDNSTVLAVNASVPIDYNLSPGLALRVSPDYLFTNFGGQKITATDPATGYPVSFRSITSTQHNLGFTAGIVYRFGRR